LRPEPDVRDLIGIPFVTGGRDPKTGLDCWGLCREALQRFGDNVPDFPMACYDALQINMIVLAEEPRWRRLDVPEHGSVVCFALDPMVPWLIQHLGVYLGGGRIIHTLEKRGSSLISMDHRFFRGKIRGFYRWSGR